MGTHPIIGQCRLCSRYRVLTFEHVPPRVSFNSGKVVEKEFWRDFFLTPRHWWEPMDMRGRQRQRGTGGYYFCGECNSFLGREYVPSFSSFVHQAAKALQPHPVEITFEPLRAIKQVVSMFMALNTHGPDWPTVAKFVRDPGSRVFPPELRLFFFVTRGPLIKMVGFQGKGTLNRPGGMQIISEVVRPPIAFQMIHGIPSDYEWRLDITPWAQFSFDEEVTARVRFPIVPAFSPMPDDYRGENRMRRDYFGQS